MKEKKIRGLKRRSKQIEKWRSTHLRIDFDYLKKFGDVYVKIWISPWQNLRHLDGSQATPNKKLRDQILNALIDIYESWEYQLKLSEEPYYLKIWLFDPRFINSEIVCGIGQKLNFYDSVFYSDNEERTFPLNSFSKIKRICQFCFESYLDEEIATDYDFERNLYKSDIDYIHHQKYLTKLKSGKARIEEIISSEEKYNAYFVKKGNVWVGSKSPEDSGE